MNTNVEHQKSIRSLLVVIVATLLIGFMLIALTTWGGGMHAHGTITHGVQPDVPSPVLGPKLNLPYQMEGQPINPAIDETGVTFNFSTYIVSDGEDKKLYEYERVSTEEMKLLRTIDVSGLPGVNVGDRLEDVDWMMMTGEYALLINNTIHVVSLPSYNSNATAIELDASDEQYQIPVDTTVTETWVYGNSDPQTRTRDVRLTSLAYSNFHSGGNAAFFYVGSSDAEPGQKDYYVEEEDYSTPPNHTTDPDHAHPADRVYIYEIRRLLSDPTNPIQFDPIGVNFEIAESLWTADAIYSPPHTPNLYILSKWCQHITEVTPQGEFVHEIDVRDMIGRPVGLYMPYDFVLDNETEMIIIDDAGEMVQIDGLLDIRTTDHHTSHSGNVTSSGDNPEQ